MGPATCSCTRGYMYEVGLWMDQLGKKFKDWWILFRNWLSVHGKRESGFFYKYAFIKGNIVYELVGLFKWGNTKYYITLCIVECW